MGFVFEMGYGGGKVILHDTRGVEGFYVQGGVLGKVSMPSNIKGGKGNTCNNGYDGRNFSYGVSRLYCYMFCKV